MDQYRDIVSGIDKRPYPATECTSTSSAEAAPKTAGPVSSLGVVGGCLEPSARRPPVFFVRAWGDEIPCRSPQSAVAEVEESLRLGATSVSVEVRESPAPDNAEAVATASTEIRNQ